jgi:hypothetical protein
VREHQLVRSTHFEPFVLKGGVLKAAGVAASRDHPLLHDR